MKNFLRFILAFYLSTTFFHSAYAAEKNSLISNPLAMTITSVLAQPKKDNFSKAKLTILPERSNVYLMEDLGQLRYRYHLQSNVHAPLVFVVPGMGGESSSSGILFVAEKLYALGYSTVTMDDPVSWGFAVAASRSGLPGYMPDDALDLYSAMQKVTAELKSSEGIQPSSYSLMGYSLGALQSVFVKNIDDQQHKFNFRRVLLVNSPTDLLNAVKQIDNLYDRGAKLSHGRHLYVFNHTAEVGDVLLKSKKSFEENMVYVEAMFAKYNFNDEDMAYLIGDDFRTGLTSLIFASQQVHDLGVLKNKATRYKQNARYEEVHKLSFVNYMSKFVYPQVKKAKGAGYTVADLNREASLYQFENMLKNDPRIFIVHSKDDFILKSGDVEWLQNTFGNRALILPYGGHCGSLNFTQMDAYMKHVFVGDTREGAPTPQ